MDMLMNGNYPHHLKKRISNGEGHLSNHQALELFNNHRPGFMSHLILSHLSKNNNDPELVRQLFHQHAAGANIIIASRYKETEVYSINPGNDIPSDKIVPIKKTVKAKQLTLFQQ